MKNGRASLAVALGLTLLPLGAFAQDMDKPEGKRPPQGERMKGDRMKQDEGRHAPRDGQHAPRPGDAPAPDAK